MALPTIEREQIFKTIIQNRPISTHFQCKILHTNMDIFLQENIPGKERKGKERKESGDFRILLCHRGCRSRSNDLLHMEALIEYSTLGTLPSHSVPLVYSSVKWSVTYLTGPILAGPIL